MHLIIAKFILAATDLNNVDIDFEKGPIKNEIDSNIASGVKVMSYFDTNLKHAILTGELGVFGKVLPLYTR